MLKILVFIVRALGIHYSQGAACSGFSFLSTTHLLYEKLIEEGREWMKELT